MFTYNVAGIDPIEKQNTRVEALEISKKVEIKYLIKKLENDKAVVEK